MQHPKKRKDTFVQRSERRKNKEIKAEENRVKEHRRITRKKGEREIKQKEEGKGRQKTDSERKVETRREGSTMWKGKRPQKRGILCRH